MTRPAVKTLLLAAALAAIGIGAAAAQEYPTRPITVIAPFPPGGPSDALARVLAGPLEAALGEPIVIENVAGAGGTIGVSRVARAEPDGYTLLIGQWSTQVVNPVTYHLAIDVVNDFAPIALLANTPQIIIARKDFPSNDVGGLIAWLKANPDKAQAATVGAAGGAQVAGMYFQRVTDTHFGFVPYRGGAPAMQDLMAGRVDIMFDQAANAITQVRAGTIKAYAVMTKDRWHLAPEIPTIDESGAEGLHISFWHALFAPRATPPDIIAKLNKTINAVLAEPAIKTRFTELGAEPMIMTPAEFGKYMAEETEKWGKVVKFAHIKPD